MSNIVAIVGRPNVGKSTLFNRLIEKRQAIVDEESGVTRDRHYGHVEWNSRRFSLIDTGGFVQNSEDVFESEINKQVLIAMEEADVLLFMTDVQNGITDLDQAVANLLRRVGKKVITVVNKVDNNELIADAQEFYGLGLSDKIFTISSANGSGTGELLDALVEMLPSEKEVEEPDIPRFAIIGRPNVGKSSLVNALLGEERNIVTPVAGTTRDSINTRYTKYNHDFFLIDTAGLRKKGKVHEDLEFYSVMRAVRTIELADVCLLLIDATRGLESQDLNILHLVQRNHKGLVVLVNKWDLAEKDTHSARKTEAVIRKKTEPFTDYPILFISALEKQRIHKALDAAVTVYQNRDQRIPTGKLNTVMLKAVEQNPPPAVKGKFIRIKYVTQLPVKAPSFAFFCNLPQYIKDPYRRYLENRLRENFNFNGVPLRIFFRKK